MQPPGWDGLLHNVASRKQPNIAEVSKRQKKRNKNSRIEK
jgi:hypothetical protein